MGGARRDRASTRGNICREGAVLGTCYQAANFQHVGTTQGRGRQDVGNEYALPVKDIYLYPLQSDVSKQLCEGQRKEVVEAKGFSDWAEEEFGNAGLGDLRLRRRADTDGS